MDNIMKVICTIGIIVFGFFIVNSRYRRVILEIPSLKPKEYHIVRLYQSHLYDVNDVTKGYKFNIDHFYIYDRYMKPVPMYLLDPKYTPLINHKLYSEESQTQIVIDILIPKTVIKQISLSSQGDRNKNTFIDVITFDSKKSFSVGNYREVEKIINIPVPE